MILSRLTPVQVFDIWAPKYSTRVVKLADYKIGHHNEIKFSKAKAYEAKSWYISGAKARSFPLVPMRTKSGSMMQVREVPIDALEPLDREVA